MPLCGGEVIDKHGWATVEEVLDIPAIGQCTGHHRSEHRHGYRSAASSAPSWPGRLPHVVIITLLASVLTQVKDSVWVARAFGGIRIAVCALIVQSIITLAKKSVVDLPSILLYIASTALTFFLGVSPIAIVVLAILCGLLVGWTKRRSST